MLLAIPEVLSPEELSRCRPVLEHATWVAGGATAGFQSARVKRNRQLRQESDEAKQLGNIVLDAVDRNTLFTSAALPARVYPPLFNRYEQNEAFGNHVDNAIRQIPSTGHRVRTDISATLFLSDPESYDGGELVVDDTYGPHVVKLPAGHMVLYPGTSLHRVQPVTRGVRLASFFWIQSLVREDAQRSILFDLDLSIVRLRRKLGDTEAIVSLTAVYHNLLRRWASL